MAEPGAGNQSGLGGQRPAIDADVPETVTEALLREYKCKLTYQARNWPEPEEIVGGEMRTVQKARAKVSRPI